MFPRTSSNDSSHDFQHNLRHLELSLCNECYFTMTHELRKKTFRLKNEPRVVYQRNMLIYWQSKSSPSPANTRRRRLSSEKWPSSKRLLMSQMASVEEILYDPATTRASWIMWRRMRRKQINGPRKSGGPSPDKLQVDVPIGTQTPDDKQTRTPPVGCCHVVLGHAKQDQCYLKIL